jgi:hypothetical protein
MRDYQFTIPAGSERGHTIRGRFLRVKSASAAVRIRAIDESGTTIADMEMTSGVRFSLPVMFTKIRIENEGGAVADVTLTAGTGDADDSSVTGSLNIAKSTTLQTVADVSILATTTTQIAAADSARREILITNLSTNTAAFRVGDSSAGAARGVEVLPGSTIALETTAAVYAYNSGAGAQSVGVLEVMD